MIRGERPRALLSKKVIVSLMRLDRYIRIIQEKYELRRFRAEESAISRP